jgi:DNA-binding protein Fis
MDGAIPSCDVARIEHTHTGMKRIEASVEPSELKAAELEALVRVVEQAVPGIVQQLIGAGSRQLHRDVLAVLERPLLAHVLALTGGNQIRAAHTLAINRNTLRKRCRELGIDAPRRLRAAAPAICPPPHGAADQPAASARETSSVA